VKSRFPRQEIELNSKVLPIALILLPLDSNSISHNPLLLFDSAHFLLSLSDASFDLAQHIVVIRFAYSTS